MKVLSYLFYYGYIGVVSLAGFYGAFISPTFEFEYLFGMDTNSLSEDVRNTMLSQYRFLRALELGFGLWTFYFTKKIFSEKIFNNLFLVIMLTGILARAAGIIFDGKPSTVMLFFMIYEIVGIIFIFIYSKMTIDKA